MRVPPGDVSPRQTRFAYTGPKPPPPPRNPPAEPWRPAGGTGSTGRPGDGRLDTTSRWGRWMSWVISGFGLLICVAAFLPWSIAPGMSISGIQGGRAGAEARDGSLVLAFGVAIAMTGLLRALNASQRGLQLALPIVSLCSGVLVTSIGAADSVGVSASGGGVGIGLWLTIFAGAAGSTASVIAIRLRP